MNVCEKSIPCGILYMVIVGSKKNSSCRILYVSLHVADFCLIEWQNHVAPLVSRYKSTLTHEATSHRMER